MSPSQEVTQLRKSGCLDEAYTRGYELLKENPGDKFLLDSIGWVLYDKVKRLVEIDHQSQAMQENISVNQVREILIDYYKLDLDRPDLLFSRLLSQTLRFKGELKFLPKFMKWAGTDSFKQEDFQTFTSNDDRVFESLVEKAARKTAKIVRDLSSKEYSDLQDLQKFAIELIDLALEKARDLQRPEWLYYYKALLFHKLERSEDARELLIPFIQQKQGDYWAWYALAKVVETSDPVLALSLCAKAYLICNNEKFSVNVLEDLSRLSAHQGQKQLAKWSADQAFTVRSKNEWKIPQSLRNLLNASCYAHTENMSNTDKVLASLTVDAERIIWANYPKYDANYLGTFTTQKGKEMVKFGRLFHGESEELAQPIRGLLNGLNLAFGEPITITIDESGEKPTVVIVEKRESGQLFDSMSRTSGQFRLNGGGFGFVDDVFVPNDLASQLKDRQMINLVVVKKLNKKKNQWGLTAIAILDELK